MLRELLNLERARRRRNKRGICLMVAYGVYLARSKNVRLVAFRCHWVFAFIPQANGIMILDSAWFDPPCPDDRICVILHDKKLYQEMLLHMWCAMYLRY